jgi:hypothetical protein
LRSERTSLLPTYTITMRFSLAATALFLASASAFAPAAFVHRVARPAQSSALSMA